MNASGPADPLLKHSYSAKWFGLNSNSDCCSKQNVRRNPQSGCFLAEDRVSQQKKERLIYLSILSFQWTALWLDCHLHDVLSFDRWWVGLYHVWSTGNTGVFCGVAQVSQCGSLSARVRRFHFWASPPFLLLNMRQWTVVPNVCWCQHYHTVHSQQQRLYLV